MCGDSTSVQLFQALVALARLRPDRRTLITDAGNFPTDQYIAESVARLLGLRLVRVRPDAVDTVLDDDTAVVALGAVDYRTGELWDAAGDHRTRSTSRCARCCGISRHVAGVAARSTSTASAPTPRSAARTSTSTAAPARRRGSTCRTATRPRPTCR